MTDQAMTPLRRRMIEDMTIRNLSPKTQQGYIRAIKNFAAFLGRSPDTATFEDVRRFQLHLVRSGVGVGALNSAVTALRFFFKVTLGRGDIEKHTQIAREPRKLPVVLSPEEVARLLEAAPGPGLKYKAVLSAAYAAGLRHRRAARAGSRTLRSGHTRHRRAARAGSRTPRPKHTGPRAARAGPKGPFGQARSEPSKKAQVSFPMRARRARSFDQRIFRVSAAAARSSSAA